MKICLAIYPINDFGGIINHVEHLAYGLKSLGHEVSIHSLHWQSKFNQVELSYPDKSWAKGAFGLPVHQYSGWKMRPWKEKLAYKGADNLKRTLDILSKYDLIIWEIPVPTRIKAHRGNHDWIQLYEACDNNILVIHDGNILSTPWIYEIIDKVSGIACVHECSYNLTENFPADRALIFNPQKIITDRILETFSKEKGIPYKSRYKGFLSLQTFKSWKHVDDLIRSIPYLPMTGYNKLVAGGGIEQRYMVSKNKVKPKYIISEKYYQDISPEFIGTKIWDHALNHKMKYLGFISEKKRDIILKKIRVLIDPSWSNSYSAHGSHFNRVIVDSMKMGAIPVAINKGMSSKKSGKSLIFTPDVNYIMIENSCTPKEYAEKIIYANNLSKSEALSIQMNNLEIVKKFSRKKIAKDFIKLSKNKPCGFFNKLEKGQINSALVKKSKEIMANFFGDKND